MRLRRTALAFAVGALVSYLAVVGPAAANAVDLAPHRAIYEMTLGTSRNASTVSSVRGRMVYQLTGNRCDGYTQDTRLVTEMGTSEGATTVSDLRSMTWEDADGIAFRFDSTTIRDQKTSETSAGAGKRGGAQEPLTIDLTRPSKSTVQLPSGTMYPVQHSIALILAARAGKTTLRADLYDGAEKGDKAYDTNARIGRKTDAAVLAALPPLKDPAVLAKSTAWPISISYFEPGKDKQDATPLYELSFLFFDNGVSRRIVIDYGDFSIRGELSELTMLDRGTCTK